MTGASTPSARRTRAEVRIKVSLQYPDRDVFVERFSHNVSRAGMFIRASDPPPVGSRVHFEYHLADGSRIMRGVGRVRWVRPRQEATPGEPPGMGVEFVDLDPQTETLIDRIVALHGEGKRAPQRARPKSAPTTPTKANTPPLTLADTHLDPEEEDALAVLVGAKPARAATPPADTPPAADELPDPAPMADAPLDQEAAPSPSEDEPVDLEAAPDSDSVEIDLDDDEEAPAVMEAEAGSESAALAEPEEPVQPTPVAAEDALAAEPVAAPAPAEAGKTWLLDLCGADLILAQAKDGKLTHRQAHTARLKAARGRAESAEDGVWVPNLLAWLSTPWPSAYAMAAARRLGLSLAGGADGAAALRLGATLVSLEDALNACLRGLVPDGGGSATVIVPAGLSAAALASVEGSLTTAGLMPATLVSDAVAVLARLKKPLADGAAAVVVNSGLFEARAALVITPDEVRAVRATLGAGLWDADELITSRAEVAYLREHGLDVNADDSLRDALGRQVGALRRAGARTTWKLNVGGKDLDIAAAEVARWCEPLSERLALTVDAALVAGGRHAGELAAVVLASEEPLWPGAAQTLAALLGSAPIIVPPAPEVRLTGALSRTSL